MLLGGFLAACLAFAVFFGLFITHYGDAAPPKEMPVVNATSVPLKVYEVGEFVKIGKKTEVIAMELAPGATEFTSWHCDIVELVARNPRGDEVARHEPSHVCDASFWIPWIIKD